MVTGPVEERLQAGTEDAPVFDCPAPLRRLHDSAARYKYPDLLISSGVLFIVITVYSIGEYVPQYWCHSLIERM